MVQTQERDALSFRRQSWLNLSLGVIGLSYAAVLIYPKAARLIDGDMTVFGVGAVANLALVFGSLMFLRNARIFRARARESQ